MTEIFKLKIDLKRNIAFVLDAIIEVGVGIAMLCVNSKNLILFYIGIGFILVGLIQLIRKLKTFHLTESELIIRRPFFPFKIAEVNFAINKIEKIKFNKISGRFGGPHLIVISNDRDGSFRIESEKVHIDIFETELNKLGVETERAGM